MSYKHEIFISYKWGEEERRVWVNEIFVPILERALYEEIGKKDVIFYDVKDIIKGATLDKSLRVAHARSKCMVVLLSLPYFTDSKWCPTEFSAMLRREVELQVRQVENFTGLIFPVVFVHEKEHTSSKRCVLYEYDKIKELIFNMSPLELDLKYNYSNKGFRDSSEYNELIAKIRLWVRDSIKPRLKGDLIWKDEWNDEKYFVDAYTDFIAKYYPIDYKAASLKMI